MQLLQAPFTAGSLTWERYGPSNPSRHTRRHDEQAKIFVMLGSSTAHWRAGEHQRWRRLPARSVSVCLGDVGAGAELDGEGQMFALYLDREYLGRRWAAAPDAELRRYSVSGTTDPYLFHLAAEAAARLRREQALSPQYVESVATLASVHVGDRYLRQRPTAPAPPSATLSPPAEARVLDHIRTHLDGRLPVADLAAVAGMSTGHFARAFRQSVGDTPHRFVVRQRVEHARQLLLGGGGRVGLADVAFRAGFSSQSHLTRCFRAVCGATPGELLRRKRPGGAGT